METAEHREPYESRGSRTDLGAPGGESPLGDSTSTVVAVNGSERPQWGDTVEKVSFELSGRCRLGAASEVDEGVAPQTGIGRAAGTSVASFRRFWAVAARWNSSRAPLGPRSRSRSSRAAVIQTRSRALEMP